MSLLFNMLSMLVIALLSRSERFLISWLQSPVAVILELKKIKSVTISIVSLSICYEMMGPDTMISIFSILSFKPAFSLFSFTFINRMFSSFSLSAVSAVSSAYIMLLLFPPAILIPAYVSSSQAFCTVHISEISRVTIYSLDILLSQIRTSPLFHNQF